jgi:hypothetical protein
MKPDESIFTDATQAAVHNRLISNPVILSGHASLSECSRRIAVHFD